jgi:FtsP/CotA-like multicopper oxidase with cupredoxin domain
VTKGQRFTFLGIAVVIAVVAAIVLGTAGGDEQESAQQQTTPAQTSTPEAASTATPEATETATPTPTPEPVAVVQPGSEQTLRFKEGETVRFKVRSPTADHVHVHGYDLFKDVPANRTVTMSFKATITGIFEIELEDSHQLLAQLRVEP